MSNDKDGVSTLLHKDLLDHLIYKKLGSLKYCCRRVNETSGEQAFVRLRLVVATCRAKLVQSGKKHYGRECSSLFESRGSAGLLSSLTTTIKTYKAAAEVRLIHASQRSRLAGLSATIHRLISEVLREARFLIKDSASLIDKIKN